MKGRFIMEGEEEENYQVPSPRLDQERRKSTSLIYDIDICMTVSWRHRATSELKESLTPASV